MSDVAEDYAANIRDFEEETEFSQRQWDPPDVWSIKRQSLRPIIPGHRLIPTSEVSLTASVAGQIIADLSQPIAIRYLNQ